MFKISNNSHNHSEDLAIKWNYYELLHERYLEAAFKKLHVSFQIISVKNPVSINKFPSQVLGKVPVYHRGNAPELATFNIAII